MGRPAATAEAVLQLVLAERRSDQRVDHRQASAPGAESDDGRPAPTAVAAPAPGSPGGGEIANMAQAVDARYVLVRRKGKPVRTGTSPTGAPAQPEETHGPEPEAPSSVESSTTMNAEPITKESLTKARQELGQLLGANANTIACRERGDKQIGYPTMVALALWALKEQAVITR